MTPPLTALAQSAGTELRRVLPVDAVLFDLDGTLADTAPDLGAALNRVREQGVGPDRLDALRSSIARGAQPAVGMARPSTRLSRAARRVSALRGGALRRYELFPDVDTLLDAIRRVAQ
jgi:phosphoglycolate phosphatase